MSCVLDIVLKILGLFVDLVRAYYERLHKAAGSDSQSIYKDHDHRQLQELCDLALLDVDSECDRSDDAEQHDHAVDPQCDVDVNEARAVNDTVMSVKQFKLSQEEVDSQHQVEDHAQDDELAAGYAHQVLNIAVVDICGVSSLLLAVRVERCLDSLSRGSYHPSDHGVVDRRAVNDLRFRVLLFFFKFFRFRRQIIIVIKDVRRPYRKQERIVHYGHHYQTDDRYQYDLVYLIEPVKVEDVESDIQIEQRVLEAEFRRVF